MTTMSETPPMTFERRIAGYGLKRAGWRNRATPAQRRRASHKMNRAARRRREQA
jgi:hypothetical protein